MTGESFYCVLESLVICACEHLSPDCWIDVMVSPVTMARKFYLDVESAAAVSISLNAPLRTSACRFILDDDNNERYDKTDIVCVIEATRLREAKSHASNIIHQYGYIHNDNLRRIVDIIIVIISDVEERKTKRDNKNLSLLIF